MMEIATGNRSEHALAQLATTGRLSNIFSDNAEPPLELEDVVRHACTVDAEYLAQCAIYAHERGKMRYVPALVAVLAARRTSLTRVVFYRVISSSKMLRAFVQLVRSGRIARLINDDVDTRHMQNTLKDIVRHWFTLRTDEAIFRGSAGSAEPSGVWGRLSMADVIRFAQPKPKTTVRAALYEYLLSDESAKRVCNIDDLPESLIVRGYEAWKLPEIVRDYEAWKRDRRLALPDVPFEMLIGQELLPEEWVRLALRATWAQLWTNLDTFARHGVFTARPARDDTMTRLFAQTYRGPLKFWPGGWQPRPENPSRTVGQPVERDPVNVVATLAARLRDPIEVKRSRRLPYQLLMMYLRTGVDVPRELRNALHEAMEIATDNVPELPGKIWVFVDVSKSMMMYQSAKVRCIDAASLFATCVVRKNPNRAHVLAFDTTTHDAPNIDPHDTVMTNTARLADYTGDSTYCSLPLAELNTRGMSADLIIYVSDNESWGGSDMMAEWGKFKRRNPEARLVCIDLLPRPHLLPPSYNRPDVLNIGGFNDAVFDVVAEFARGRTTAHWVDLIRAIDIQRRPRRRPQTA